MRSLRKRVPTRTTTWPTWAALAFVVAAAITLAIGGSVTVWDDDAGEQISVTRIHSSAWFLLLLSALAAAGCGVALRSRRGQWTIVVSALAGAVGTASLRASVLSDAADVNDHLMAKGGLEGLSTRITRAASGPITRIDAGIIGTAWMISAVLLAAGAALVGWSTWFGRRRPADG